MAGLVPGFQTARSYERSWLGPDAVAGFVLVGLLAPAGMAYATAAGLPPVTGLYATIVPMLLYAVFGPSRIFVIAPDSSLAPLIAAAVVPIAGGDADTAIALGSVMALIAGGMCILAGLARFGFVAELLSAPVRYGYLHGIALTIIISQTAKLCGFSVSGETVIRQVDDFIDQLRADAFNGWALAVGLGCLAVLLVLRAIDRRIPGPLIVVVLGIVATVVLGLDDKGVALVGELPQGFPQFGLPDVDRDSWRTLVGASAGVALVAFADTSVLSRTMGLRRHEHVDQNHELIALGIANAGAGLAQGFPISASSSRTPVAESMGARTQLTGVVAAAVLIALIAVAPGAFRNLPDPALAAIVIAAAISLIDIPAMVRLWRVRRSEFVLSLAAFLSVALFGPVNGVVLAVALSLLNFIRRAWKPHTAELVRVDGLKGYHDRERHPEGKVVPGLMLYRFDAPLFFANARFFTEDLEDRLDARQDPVDCVIITAEPITDIDTTAADAIKELVSDLERQGIELRFAELKGTVHDRLDQYHAFDGLAAPDHTARTTGEAVRDYLHDYGVEWTDWEDQ